jgi:thiamine pyrophosphokinase
MRAEISELVVVVCGGDAPHAGRLPDLGGAWVIGADGGIDTAHALGLRVDLAVGDFDSVTPEGLARVEAEGGVVEGHPQEKDETDLELALLAAVGRRPDRVLVVGGDRGRLDHLLVNVGLLAVPALADVDVTGHFASATLTVVRPGQRAELTGRAGELVSLIPAHGPAIGVTTTGLQYPLRDEDLPPGTSRGTSNVFEQPTATVEIRGGAVVAVQPLQEEPS